MRQVCKAPVAAQSGHFAAERPLAAATVGATASPAHDPSLSDLQLPPYTEATNTRPPSRFWVPAAKLLWVGTGRTPEPRWSYPWVRTEEPGDRVEAFLG